METWKASPGYCNQCAERPSLVLGLVQFKGSRQPLLQFSVAAELATLAPLVAFHQLIEHKVDYSLNYTQGWSPGA
jgi:hypothetical protein